MSRAGRRPASRRPTAGSPRPRGRSARPGPPGGRRRGGGTARVSWWWYSSEDPSPVPRRVELGGLDDGHYRSVLPEERLCVEAAEGALVARRPGLVHAEQDGVAVAVDLHGAHVLHVTRGLPLDPALSARAAEVHAAAGGQRLRQRRVVHPRHHEHASGRRVLHDGRDEAVVGPAELPRDPRVEGVAAHRTVTPSPAIAALTSGIVISPKWNTLAASTASAPARTAGAKCSTAPAPPEATTGTVTASRTARTMSRSKPDLVPSASMELRRISPTPSPCPRRAQSTASIPVPRRPPWVVTSPPDGVGRSPSGTVRASTDRTMHWEPKRRLSSPSSSGRAMAAVLTLTLSAPARSSSSTSSAVRTPPPAVSGMKICSAVRRTRSIMV